jgi:cytochrome P450
LQGSLEIGIALSSLLGLFGPVSGVVNYCLSWIPVPGINYLQRVSRESVEDRMARVQDSEKNGGEPRKDMLTKLVQAKNPVSKQPLNKVELITHASSIVGAGSDTTSITMRAFFIFVLSNPVIKQRLIEEIDNAFKQGTLTFPATYRDGVKLQYFQACLKETLRLYPAVSYILERIVPENELLQLGEYTISPGCIVGISPTTYHRQVEIYGANARSFDPTRWLVSEEKLSYLERQNLAFGAGSRVCLGKNISLMEMTKVLPYLLYRYDFEFTPRSANSPHAMAIGRGHDEKQGPEIPYYIESSWFSNPKDFFCNVSLRHNE